MLITCEECRKFGNGKCFTCDKKFIIKIKMMSVNQPTNQQLFIRFHSFPCFFIYDMQWGACGSDRERERGVFLIAFVYFFIYIFIYVYFFIDDSLCKSLASLFIYKCIYYTYILMNCIC